MASTLDLIRGQSKGIRLFLLTFLTLYLELALIRLTSAEVLYLGFFSNFVLISVFLGIGLGFLLAKKEFTLFRFVPQVVLFVVAFVLVTRIDVSFLRDNAGQIFFGGIREAMPLPLWVCLPLIFACSTFLFACISQETARCFPHFSPLTAYSIDIAGSLAGIAVFTFHSYVGATPVLWFALSLGVVAVLSTHRWWIQAVLVGVGVVLLLISVSPSHYTRWSPYQRIEVQPTQLRDGTEYFEVNANGILHQNMMPVGRGEGIYDFPYTTVQSMRGRSFEDVLIIGAGSGTDVAYSLAAGATRVDAVEIDPEILRAGEQFHPSQPYADPRVHAHVNDGRAHMQHTDQRYDLIIFALPDSLASLSNFANIRLESFLFTMESFQQAQKLLKEDGVVVLYNYYRKQWLAEKLADMLTEVFGHPPIVRVYSGEHGGMLVAMAVGQGITGEPREGELHTFATDNWPFLYMQNPHLPSMYVLLIFLFIGCAVLGVLATGNLNVKAASSNLPFLLMGAAFLLLETKSVIQFSLLFGSTWLVNSLVFFAVLCSVLIANLLVAKLNIRRPAWIIGLLLGTLVIQVVVPLNLLLEVEVYALRYILASLLLFSPIFCANLLFGTLFRDTPHSDVAFGWNIIGTMIGGALEYTSLWMGYHSLTIVIGVLYALCALWVFTVTRRAAPA